jgi:hypothetical protein
MKVLFKSAAPPSELADRTYTLMMLSLGEVTATLERLGWDPCPAMKEAERCMKHAWSAWNYLLESAEPSDRSPR